MEQRFQCKLGARDIPCNEKTNHFMLKAPCQEAHPLVPRALWVQHRGKAHHLAHKCNICAVCRGQDELFSGKALPIAPILEHLQMSPSHHQHIHWLLHCHHGCIFHKPISAVAKCHNSAMVDQRTNSMLAETPNAVVWCCEMPLHNDQLARSGPQKQNLYQTASLDGLWEFAKVCEPIA